jgi:hypothetical protein
VFRRDFPSIISQPGAARADGGCQFKSQRDVRNDKRRE